MIVYGHNAGARYSLGSESLCCKGLDPPAWWIYPAWQMHLVFGLFSIPISGMCCPVCGKVHMELPLLLVGKSSLCGNTGFPLKKYVTMTIFLMSNGWWYENQCALEVSLNKIKLRFMGITPWWFHRSRKTYTGPDDIILCAKPKVYAIVAGNQLWPGRYSVIWLSSSLQPLILGAYWMDVPFPAMAVRLLENVIINRQEASLMLLK